jgi:hypothetical protein
MNAGGDDASLPRARARGSFKAGIVLLDGQGKSKGAVSRTVGTIA